jgi:hypothetical protein
LDGTLKSGVCWVRQPLHDFELSGAPTARGFRAVGSFGSFSSRFSSPGSADANQFAFPDGTEE